MSQLRCKSLYNKSTLDFISSTIYTTDKHDYNLLVEAITFNIAKIKDDIEKGVLTDTKGMATLRAAQLEELLERLINDSIKEFI